MRVGALLCLLLCLACGQPVQEAPAPNPIVFDVSPLPFPYAPSGLAFQMTDAPQQLKLAKPIGDGLLDANGNVYLSFPEQGAVVGFLGTELKAFFWGPEALGGQGEMLDEPSGLAKSGGDLDVVNGSRNRVMRLSPQAPMSWPEPGLPCYPLGQDRFLLPRQGEIRDGKGALLRQLGQAFEEPLLVAASEDGGLVLGQRIPQGTELAIFGGEGVLRTRLRLPAVLDGLAVVDLSLAFTGERVWVLFTLGAGERRCRLAVVDLRGTVRHYWYLPTTFDGMSHNGRAVLFFEKESGRAQTHTLR